MRRAPFGTLARGQPPRNRLPEEADWELEVRAHGQNGPKSGDLSLGKVVLRLPGVTPGAVANPVHEVLEKAPTRTHDQQPVDDVLVGQDAEGRDSWRGDGTAPRQGELGRLLVLALALRDCLQLFCLVFGICRGEIRTREF